MNTKRPVNVNVFNYRFPIPAIASILHRVSGVLLFLAIPFMMWLLQLSLSSPTDFEQARSYLEMPLVKFLIWGCVTALFYHLFAGIRHMLMDLGYAESLAGGRASAKIIIAISMISAILVGVWLW